MAGEQIRVGIIGANAHYGWSMRAHLPALRAMPDYELTAVCTSRPENHLEIRPKERIDAVLDDHGLVGERLHLRND